VTVAICVVLGGIGVRALIGSPASPEAPTSLPTWRSDLSGFPLGMGGGQLVRDGVCVYAEAGSEKWLPIWPPGTHLDDQSVVAASGRTIGVIGGRIRFGGGRLTSYDQARFIVGADLPAACRTAEFWEVTVGDGCAECGYDTPPPESTPAVLPSTASSRK
jgi:hypothetical protein